MKEAHLYQIIGLAKRLNMFGSCDDGSRVSAVDVIGNEECCLSAVQERGLWWRKSLRFSVETEPIVPILVEKGRIIFANKSNLKEKDLSSRMMIKHD
jgi:hypothetical protein